MQLEKETLEVDLELVTHERDVAEKEAEQLNEAKERLEGQVKTMELQLRAFATVEKEAIKGDNWQLKYQLLVRKMLPLLKESHDRK